MQSTDLHCLLAVGLLILFCHIARAGVPGVCTASHMRTMPRFALDKEKGVWIMKNETYQFPVQTQECCSGYQTRSLQPLTCLPVCDPPCVKSDCMAPNTCVCYPGHHPVNNSTSDCYDVCDSCVNGHCLSDDVECTCLLGYLRDKTFPHICNPVCSPSCVNATCENPQECKCLEGYTKADNSNNICVPKCSKNCVFGTCTDPEVCTCFEGYTFKENVCLPVCDQTCENGHCAAPNSCECQVGFELHPSNSFHCVPKAPENSSLNTCNLKLHKAVKFDKDTDCFVMKDKATVSGDARCQSLADISRPSCSQTNACGLNECILNFRCSAIKTNHLNEIHCYLETNDFQSETIENSTVNGIEWTDVVLVVNSYRHIGSYLNNETNVTRSWYLTPLSERPVCGQMHFGVEICGSATYEVKNAHINSSIMTLINTILIIGVLLLAGAGVGGFLWARHRKLNNPLNYREDMIRGEYYNNACYDNQPTHLASDDESEDEHDFDAPL